MNTITGSKNTTAIQFRRAINVDAPTYSAPTLWDTNAKPQIIAANKCDTVDDDWRAAEFERFGLPVFATCAGLILLAEKIDDPGRRDATRPEKWFGVLPVAVKRNAYGRQLGSFTTIGKWDGIPDTTMTFIRAPSITAVSDGVEVLSTFDGQPTSVRWRNITAFTWHPELSATA